MDWTPQEKWIWEEVCEGRAADLENQLESLEEIDPKDAETWPDSRVVRPDFLETILLHKLWRSAIHRRGVRIVGAWSKEELDLSSASLTSELWLNQSRFESNVQISYLRSPRPISFDGSSITDTLNMDGAEVGSDLFMRESIFSPEKNSQEIFFVFGRVGQNLDLSGAHLPSFNGTGLEIAGELRLALGNLVAKWQEPR